MFDEISLPCIPDDVAKDFRVAIVAASWHKDIVTSLITSARETAHRAGVKEDAIALFQVMGTYELPQMVQALAKTKKYNAIVPLGCVIKGDTNHFELICETIARGFDEIGRNMGIPISFGVVTTNNKQDAVERAGGSKGNKGMEAMAAGISLAISMKAVQ